MHEAQTEEEVLALAAKIKARRAEESKVSQYSKDLNRTVEELRDAHSLRRESCLDLYMVTSTGYTFTRKIKVPQSRIHALLASEVEAIGIN